MSNNDCFDHIEFSWSKQSNDIRKLAKQYSENITADYHLLNIKNHCIKRYIQRINNSLNYLEKQDRIQARKEIYELLELSVLASEEETHFIRHSRRKPSTLICRDSKYLIYNKELAFVKLNNEILTCFECSYLKHVLHKKPINELINEPINKIEPIKKQYKQHKHTDDTIDQEFLLKVAKHFLTGGKIYYDNHEKNFIIIIVINNWEIHVQNIDTLNKLNISIDDLHKYKLIIKADKKSKLKLLINFKKSLFSFD